MKEDIRNLIDTLDDIVKTQIEKSKNANEPLVRQHHYSVAQAYSIVSSRLEHILAKAVE